MVEKPSEEIEVGALLPSPARSGRRPARVVDSRAKIGERFFGDVDGEGLHPGLHTARGALTLPWRFPRILPPPPASEAVQPRRGASVSETTAIPAARPGRMEAILAFLAIYLIWGSTFLAIRFAVESIPPLFTAGTRHLVAGSILLGWALWKGERPTRQGLRAGLILGFLFFFVSHGLLHWAELKVPSGVAALVIAIEPAIVAVLLPLLKLGPGPRGATWGGLALGAVSVALLFRPEVSADPSVLIGLTAVLVSAISWSLGIVYARRLQPANGATLNAALP